MISRDQNISQLKPSIEIILIDKLNAKVRQEHPADHRKRDRPSPLLFTGELTRRSHIECRVTMNLVDHGLKRSKNISIEQPLPQGNDSNHKYKH